MASRFPLLPAHAGHLLPSASWWRDLGWHNCGKRLVKTGGRLVKHARYYWLLLAESHLTRRLFGSMVRRIEALPVPAG